jgi:FkbM family methyltransferase
MFKFLKSQLAKNFPSLSKKLSYFYHAHLIRFIWLLTNRPNGTLVYVGVNVGESFGKMFYQYERVIGYEPNPNNYKKLKAKFGFFNNVELYNFAAADTEGEHDFFLSNNDNDEASSSLLNFSSSRNIQAKKVIKVKTVILENHLEQIGVKKIDEYISDTEGYDFCILKSLSKFIQENRIHFITSEVVIDGKPNPFSESSNYESDFDGFLPKNYCKVASGWGILEDGKYSAVPDSYNFMDVRWRNANYEK